MLNDERGAWKKIMIRIYIYIYRYICKTLSAFYRLANFCLILTKYISQTLPSLSAAGRGFGLLKDQRSTHCTYSQSNQLAIWRL